MRNILLAMAVSAAMLCAQAEAKDLNRIGISVGSLGNPFFVALAKGATDKAKSINPNIDVVTVGYDYDLNKQFTQIDNFIAAGVDLILLNPSDPNAVEPAIKRAQAAGIIVIAVDTAAKGADAAVMTNNIQAGELACQYIVDQLLGKGKVIIENGPQVSSVIDRVNGCKSAFEKAPGIELLSSNQDAKGSRDGGLSVGQGLLTRFDQVDAIFAINDQQALGTELAAKQLGRSNIIITSVDGAPDIENALKRGGAPLIQASASQDPYAMAQLATEIGVKLLRGEKPEQPVRLIPSKLITQENVREYKGWTAHR